MQHIPPQFPLLTESFAAIHTIKLQQKIQIKKKTNKQTNKQKQTHNKMCKHRGNYKTCLILTDIASVLYVHTHIQPPFMDAWEALTT